MKMWRSLLAEVLTVVAGLATIWVVLPEGIGLRVGWTVALLATVSLWPAWQYGIERGQRSTLSQRRILENDLELLSYWLDEWRLHSEFVNWLSGWPDEKRVPSAKIREIEGMLDRSDARGEPRCIRSAALAELFATMRSAAASYKSVVGECMWYADSGRGTPMDMEYLQIPIEWDYEKKDRYVKDLGTTREDFRVELRRLLQKQYDLERVFSEQES